MQVWIASGNRGKLDEFRSLLAAQKIEVHSQGELEVFSPPPENADSFEGNARLKARSLRSIKNQDWVIADDSGLEVDGLNNLPGIHSARYAGPKATDAENTNKLLKMMSLRSATNRKARFRCVMVAYSPDGTESVFDGVLEGTIAKSMRGDKGFGYDNVFIPDGEEKTLAELGQSFKNKISHRAQAIRKFSEIL